MGGGGVGFLWRMTQNEGKGGRGVGRAGGRDRQRNLQVIAHVFVKTTL